MRSDFSAGSLENTISYKQRTALHTCICLSKFCTHFAWSCSVVDDSDSFFFARRFRPLLCVSLLGFAVNGVGVWNEPMAILTSRVEILSRKEESSLSRL